MNKQEKIIWNKLKNQYADNTEVLDVLCGGENAREKQIAKKPILYGDSEDGKLLCPSCEDNLWDIKECGFSGCPYCLQAIDWGNKDE